MKIQLTKQEMHECKILGVDTVTLVKMQSVKPRLENERQSREDANVLGFMAEFAVAKLFGLKPTYLVVKSDYGIDLWWDDVSIDVKYTNNIKNGLIFDDPDSFKADVAILCAPTEYSNVIDVVGWVGRNRFLEDCHHHDFGYGDRLVLDADDLDLVRDLWVKMSIRKFSPYG